MGTRLFLLGRFEVEKNGESLPRAAWKRKRPVQLLTALALAPGLTLHREELLDRLWPEKDLDAGANNLYRTLHELRRIAGDSVVAAERGSIRLAEDTWVDVVAFERAVAAGSIESLTEAVALYRGDLMPDDPYADELQARREGLRQRFVDAALRLSDLDPDPSRRIDVLRRVVEIDPTLERAHRGLMLALAQSGRGKDALRQFAVCVQALRDRLDTEPSPDTLALQRQITAGEVDSAPSPPSSLPTTGPNWPHVAARLLGTDQPPPLYGRDDAMQAIQSFSSSDRGVLLLIGEAGFGKTRLAVECARHCGTQGDTLLVGLGYDLESAAPYTPFIDAWSDYLRVADRPASEHPFLSFRPIGASAQDDRARLFQSVERALVELAIARSVCLLIEDLHDADESSLYLLYHLARASRHLPLKIVGTVRAENIRVGQPLHTVLGGLARERLATRVELEPLDREATRALVQSIRGSTVDDATVASIHRLCGGNPFFTEEVARSSNDGVGPTAAVASEDLLRSIHDRVKRLGPSVERLLVAAAVAGLRFDFEVVRAALGADPDAALDALDAGLAGRVIEEHDAHYRFRHALTRRALYDSLSHARRVFLHRAIADALEASASRDDTVGERLAHHHQLAGQLDRALPYIIAAAERARARLGFGEAVAFCEQALELMDALGIGADPQRFATMSALGAMRLALGDLPRAVAVLDDAAALGGASWQPQPAQRAQALRLGALALIEGGILDAAEERLDAALVTLQSDPDNPELSHAYYLFSQLRWHQSRHTEAYALAERCLQHAERHDEPQAIARGYEMLALACHSLGDWKQGTEFERRRSSLVDGPLDVASAFDVHL